jgi:hypothetical protein
MAKPIICRAALRWVSLSLNPFYDANYSTAFAELRLSISDER